MTTEHALFSALLQKDIGDDFFGFILPPSSFGMGDVFIVFRLKKPFERAHQKNVTLIGNQNDANHRKVARIVRHLTTIHLLNDEHYWLLLSTYTDGPMRATFEKGKGEACFSVQTKALALVVNPWLSFGGQFLQFYPLSFYYTFLRMLSIPHGYEMDAFTPSDDDVLEAKRIFLSHSFQYDNTVLVVTHSSGLRLTDFDFGKVIERFNALGFSTCYDAREDMGFPATRLFLAPEILKPFAELCGTVFLPRSGVADIIDKARCFQYIIYPDSALKASFSMHPSPGMGLEFTQEEIEKNLHLLVK